MGFQIGIKDIIDILLVAFLLFQTFKLLKRSGAINVFFGIMGFIIVWFLVTHVFRMELLGAIFDRIISVGAFALIVLFQDEIRRFFSRVGSKRRSKLMLFFKKMFGDIKSENAGSDFYIVQIVLACKYISKSGNGALIVITRENDLETYTNSGEQINASINSRLIENIFFKNSPLHDGALVVSNGKLKAAACILPVSRNLSVPKHFGLRHRAALGITEQTDAVAIAVSEETGRIACAVNGDLKTNLKPEELEQYLSDLLK